ncbi:MAG: DMT family transporter [Deltaproteobacteria bacterium]|nr:DMT family transporter [Deltaproteobacteria bacterium]
MASSKKTVAVLALILAAMLWGSSFFMIQETMTHDIWFMVGIRLLIGALGILVISRGRCLKVDKKYIPLFLLIGFWISVTFFPQALGLRGTSVANSAVITALFVVLTPALLFILKKGKPTNFQWVGSLIGILAFFLLGLSQGFSTLNWYDALTFVTALAVAFHTVYFTEALKHPKNLYPVCFFQFVVGGTLLLIVHFLLAATSHETVFFPTLTTNEWLGIFYLGFFTTSLPYALQGFAQLSVGPVQALLVISSEPLWAIAEASLIRGDPISGAALFSSGLLIIANVVAELKGKNPA